MDINNDKFEKYNSEERHGNDVIASATTFKRNMFGQQKTCM